MERPRPILYALATLALLAPLRAQEAVTAAPVHRMLESKITRAALFKNGLAVVTRSVRLPGAGAFDVGDVPEAVHGTLWIASDAPVDAISTTREVEVPADANWRRDPQEEVAGRRVHVKLSDEDGTEIVGRVARFQTDEGNRSWSRSFEQQRHRYWNASTQPLPTPTASELAIDTDRGRVFVSTHAISFLRVENPRATRKEQRPVLRLVAGEGAQSGVVDVTYLVKGLSYAPSYRIDITDPSRLQIAQVAVLRNELEALEDVELHLISGFPSMEFSHVVSPLSLATTWAEYFAQLGMEFDSSRGNRQVITQNAVFTPPVSSAAPLATEGVDLYYHPIGRRSLREGDAMQVLLASAGADYERIVEWKVPDPRDEWGRPHSSHRWKEIEESGDHEAWDSLRFQNPFGFPMTTAPATIVEGPRFLGQRTSRWINPSEETVLRVTKALSIRTDTTEYEAEESRDKTKRYGVQYRRALVRGEVHLTNHREEPVRMIVRRAFSGELQSADREPERRLLAYGVYSANPRRELIWTVDLAAGEELRLEYTYEVLVRL